MTATQLLAYPPWVAAAIPLGIIKKYFLRKHSASELEIFIKKRKNLGNHVMILKRQLSNTE